MTDRCLMCQEAIGSDACKLCPFGNPCLDCLDYDRKSDTCKSNGGCGAEGGGSLREEQ